MESTATPSPQTPVYYNKTVHETNPTTGKVIRIKSVPTLAVIADTCPDCAALNQKHKGDLYACGVCGITFCLNHGYVGKDNVDETYWEHGIWSTCDLCNLK